MGNFLSGAIHAIGDVAAPLLYGTGALTNNKSLMNAATNIANPNVTLSNPSGILQNNNQAFTGIGSAYGSSAMGYAGVPVPHNAQQGQGSSTPAQQPSTNGVYSGTNGAAAAPVVNNQPLIDLINGALGRLPGELQTAQSNIHNQFDTNNNQLQSGFDQAQLQNQQQTAQNGQQYRLNKNQIADSSSMGLTSLLRVLGAHGAGGSSDALNVAPQLVAQQASQERAGAGQTYGQNQQGIDTNWNAYQTGFGNSKKQLNDWLSQQLNNASSQSLQTQGGLEQQLLGLQPDVAAAQPYVDKINSLAGQVDQLAKFNPTYNGVTPTYTPQSVASYTVNPNTTVQQNGNSALDSATTPYLSMLLGQTKKQQKTPLGA